MLLSYALVFNDIENYHTISKKKQSLLIQTMAKAPTVKQNGRNKSLKKCGEGCSNHLPATNLQR
jgi:hypothetical protein